MKTVIVVSAVLILSSGALFAATATPVNKKLTIKEIRALSIESVRQMYNQKKDQSLHVGKMKGYAACELYDKAKKGTCSVQFSARQETITKCLSIQVRGRNKVRCHTTNLMFFFPNAVKRKKRS